MNTHQKTNKKIWLLLIMAIVFTTMGIETVNARHNDHHTRDHVRSRRVCKKIVKHTPRGKIVKTRCKRIRVSPRPTPTPTPTPEPTLSHIVISEVYYDVVAERGAETDNEWIELYNNTGQSVDISGWIVADANTQRTLPDNVVLDDKQYALITNKATTVDFWTIPSDALVIVLDTAIGNGLGNTGDAITLSDSNNVLVDELSYGSNIDIMDPAIADAQEGHSIARSALDEDTDTATDWTAHENPTPGM